MFGAYTSNTCVSFVYVCLLLHPKLRKNKNKKCERLPSKEALQEAFVSHANGEETIDIDQFKHMCYMLYLAPTDNGIEQLFEEIDCNKDDRLSFSEVSLLIERQWTPFEERKKSFLHDLRKCRRRKGPMTRDELRQILQRGNAEALCDYDVDYVFKRLDLNHDNLITEEEITECIFRYESRGHGQEVDASEYLADETHGSEHADQNEENEQIEDLQEELGENQEESGVKQEESGDVQDENQEERIEQGKEAEDEQETGEHVQHDSQETSEDVQINQEHEIETQQDDGNAGEQDTNEQTGEQTETNDENEQQNEVNGENQTAEQESEQEPVEDTEENEQTEQEAEQETEQTEQETEQETEQTEQETEQTEQETEQTEQETAQTEQATEQTEQETEQTV